MIACLPTRVRRAATFLAILGSALWPLLLLACGGSGAPSGKAVTELQRVSPLKPGQPVLVFVYTDG